MRESFALFSLGIFQGMGWWSVREQELTGANTGGALRPEAWSKLVGQDYKTSSIAVAGWRSGGRGTTGDGSAIWCSALS